MSDKYFWDEKSKEEGDILAHINNIRLLESNFQNKIEIILNASKLKRDLNILLHSDEELELIIEENSNIRRV
tara:strand:- start:119 stop:334 length:216 start_codon:yes stop_codon:yes gene_type:complete